MKYFFLHSSAAVSCWLINKRKLWIKHEWKGKTAVVLNFSMVKEIHEVHLKFWKWIKHSNKNAETGKQSQLSRKFAHLLFTSETFWHKPPQISGQGSRTNSHPLTRSSGSPWGQEEVGVKLWSTSWATATPYINTYTLSHIKVYYCVIYMCAVCNIYKLYSNHSTTQ